MVGCLKLLGYHDAYASGVIHAIAGGFALGILIVLGPRIGKFSSSGEPRNIGPRNPWLVTIGLFLIYTGFWGFYAACNIPIFDLGPEYGMEGVTYFTATKHIRNSYYTWRYYNELPDVIIRWIIGWICGRKRRSILDLLKWTSGYHLRFSR